MNIKILDCTLRDGGYVNNWNFGYENIKKIISNLSFAKIDYIECGFLKDIEYDLNKSIFNEFSFESNIPKLALMLNYGDFDLNKLLRLDFKNYILRVAFKKDKCDEALEFCAALIKNGFNVFINPMNTISYSDYELLDLIDKVNKIKPKTLTIVDTLGQMNKNDTISLFYLFDKNLNESISIGYHSHNSLALSFSNVQAILEKKSRRSIIIDSSLFGIGRGAGNLQTELLTQYLNDYYQKKYETIPILKTIQEIINPIFEANPWGYSVPYRIAALNSCHPDYAKYLIDKKVNIEVIDKVLKNIPTEKRASFDCDFIKNIVIE